MAAWLAFLKSRLLLPPDPTDEGPSGEELAAHLAFQLERLSAMRDCAAKLMARDQKGRDFFVRGIPEDVHRANMERIVAEAKANGFRNIICITSPPYEYDETGICDTLLEIPLFLEDSKDGLHLGERGAINYALSLGVKLNEVFGV